MAVSENEPAFVCLPSEEALYTVYGFSGELPNDLADYYAALSDPLTSSSYVTDSSNQYSGGLDADGNLFIRHDGYWYHVTPIPEEGLEKYWKWFKSLDYKKRLIIGTNNEGKGLPEDLAREILQFFPEPPTKLSFWDSAYISIKVITSQIYFKIPEGSIYGKYNPSADFINKYSTEIETMEAKAREQSGEWFHPWTKRSDSDSHSLRCCPNPFNSASEEAAAWDFGEFDGRILGYLLGVNDLPRIVHDPTAFHSIEFPSSEYAQIYNNAFSASIESGYDHGIQDFKDSYFLTMLDLQKKNTWAHIISAGCALTNALKII